MYVCVSPPTTSRNPATRIKRIHSPQYQYGYSKNGNLSLKNTGMENTINRNKYIICNTYVCLYRNNTIAMVHNTKALRKSF